MQAKQSKNTNPWASLDAIMRSNTEPQGAEWFTVEDFAQRYGLHYQRAASKLKDMVRAGMAKQWKGYNSTSKRVTLKYRMA